MAVGCPAAGVGNGDGDNIRTAGKDAVIDGTDGTDPAAVTYFGRGRPDRVEVERMARVHQADPRHVCHLGEVPPIGNLREGDELYSEIGERGTHPPPVSWRAEHLV